MFISTSLVLLLVAPSSGKQLLPTRIPWTVNAKIQNNNHMGVLDRGGAIMTQHQANETRSSSATTTFLQSSTIPSTDAAEPPLVRKRDGTHVPLDRDKVSGW